MTSPTRTPDPCRRDTFDRAANLQPNDQDRTSRQLSRGREDPTSYRTSPESTQRSQEGPPAPVMADRDSATHDRANSPTGGTFFVLPSRFGLFGLVEVRPEAAEGEL